MSYYEYKNFREACCSHRDSIILINPVPKTAYRDFNLKNKKEVLDFICNDGLEDRVFINTKEWEKNPNPKEGIMVDAYKFRTIHRLGYIAFMYNEHTQKWIIKSLHLSEDRNPIMYIALQKAGLFDLEE
ncbi:MAG: hypothetical protein U5P10_14820 [Spirochaetia bacterium]|nr:hypothetical protein [Spirochaetia bacterium]